MGTLNVAPFILANYPETSPYDLKPVPFRVDPGAAPFGLLSEQFRAALRHQTRVNGGLNPFHRLYGHNPYVIHDTTVPIQPILPPSSHPCPVLPLAPRDGPIVFLKQVEHPGAAVAFTIEYREKVYLMKVYSATQRPAFERECHAYAHFQQEKTYERDAVLKCSGQLELSEEEVSQLTALPNTVITSNIARPVTALLFEYYKEAVPFTTANIYRQSAEKAMRALCAVHASYIVHGAVCGPNALKMSASLVVWANFEQSTCSRLKSLSRQDFLGELEHAWDHFYTQILPDKLIRLDRDSL